MQGPIIGVELPKNTNFASLDATLGQIADEGFDVVEISLDAFPLIVGGRICQPWVDVLAEVLPKYPLAYTAHIGQGLDLRDMNEARLHRSVLLSSLEICHQLGMDVLVVHYEVKSNDRRIEEHFLEAHRWAGDAAHKLGIRLCVENIEVELIEPLVRFIEDLAHPQVSLTLDTGHAYLASRYFNFDLLDAIASMAPYLGHVHLNDNTGVFEALRVTDRRAYDAMGMGYRRQFGRGDIHLPPYYGSVPFDAIFSILHHYNGTYVCEYPHGDYGPLNRSIQETVRERIGASRAARPESV